jgi:hypothetical protein
MKSILVLTILALLVLPFALADDPVTKLRVLHPLDQGFQMLSTTQNGTFIFWLVDGYPIVVKRDQGLPPFQVSVYNNSSNDILDIVVGNGANPDDCCWFDCLTVPYGLNELVGGCIEREQTCEECV